MTNEQALDHIQQNIEEHEELVDFFQAQKPPSFWLFLLIGPLGAFGIKHYYVAVTTTGLHFHRLNLWSKFKNHDFFKYDEIENVKIGNGLLQNSMKFMFSNGRKFKIKARLTELSRNYMEDEITTIQ